MEYKLGSIFSPVEAQQWLMPRLLTRKSFAESTEDQVGSLTRPAAGYATLLRHPRNCSLSTER